MELPLGKNHRRASSGKHSNGLLQNHSSPELRFVMTKLSEMKTKLESAKIMSSTRTKKPQPQFELKNIMGSASGLPVKLPTEHKLPSTTTIQTDNNAEQHQLRKQEIREKEKQVTSLLLKFDKSFCTLEKKLDGWLSDAVTAINKMHEDLKKQLAARKDHLLGSAQKPIENFIRTVSKAKKKVKLEQPEDLKHHAELDEQIKELQDILHFQQGGLDELTKFRQMVQSLVCNQTPIASYLLEAVSIDGKDQPQSVQNTRNIFARSPSIERQSLQPTSQRIIEETTLSKLVLSQPRLPKYQSLASLHSDQGRQNRTADPNTKRLDFSSILQQQKLQYHSIKHSLGL